MSFIDPNIPRKNALQNAHLQSEGALTDGSPVFSEVEFSITGLCNRTCHFCPRVDPEAYPNLNEHLTPELFTKAVKDLSDIDYSGRLVFSGFSEPLLHKNVFELLRISRDTLQKCQLEVVTNGDRLTSEVINELFMAGLTTLLVSMYDGPEQIPQFESIIEMSDISADRIILRERYLPVDKGYGINLTNRAGNVAVPEAGVRALREPMKHPCYYTHYRMMVDHHGDVLLCPHDWGKRLIVGNLKDEHIVDIWTGKILGETRKQLGKGNRAFSPCDVCDVLGTRQGQQHFDAWQSLHQKNLANP